MALATLSVDLVAKLARFESDLGKAARASERTGAQISSAFSAVKSTLVGFGIGAALTGLVSFARASIDSVDALNDLKDATGASIENISAIENVAARTGTSMETVSAALIKFNKVLSDAKPGTEAAQILEALGLNIKELNSLDPAEALQRAAVAISRFADDGEKARAVQVLFGKSIGKVAPLLKDLAESGKLVTTVTTEQAEAAEKFKKELFAIGKTASDFGRAVALPIVAGLNAVIAKLREVNTEGKEGIFGRGLARGGLGKVGAGGLPIVFDPNDESAAEKARLSRKRDLVLPGAPVKAGKAGGSRAEEISDAQRALASYVEGLSRAVTAEEKLSEVQKASSFLASLGKTGEIKQVRDLVLGMAEQIDSERTLADFRKSEAESASIRAKLINDETEEIEGLNKAIEDLSGRTDDARKRALTARLEAQLAAGAAFTPEELERIVKGIGGITDAVKETGGVANELGLSFASAFEDAITGAKSLRDIVKGLEQDILSTLKRTLVTKPLTDAIGGEGGVISNIFGAIFGGFRAFGGPVRAGTPYIVGERGPELMVPRSSGSVVPNSRLGGSSVNLVVNQSFAPGTSRATTMQAAADARRQLESAGRNL